MAIHSHIQIPNTVLKHFRDESDSEQKIWYLDISTKQINKKPSKRLGTAKGYYSNDGEHYWSSIIETPIGRLNQQVLSFCAGDISTITITTDDMNTVKRYIQSAMVRSNLALEAMKSEMIYLDVFSEQQLHDAFSVIGMSIVGKITNALDFDEMVATILVNSTERNLVVPRNCFYCVIRDGHPNYIMPISPKGALLLMPKTQLWNPGHNYGVIETSEQVLLLNKHALKYECLLNGAFIASNSRSELEYLQGVLTDPPW